MSVSLRCLTGLVGLLVIPQCPLYSQSAGSIDGDRYRAANPIGRSRELRITDKQPGELVLKGGRRIPGWLAYLNSAEVGFKAWDKREYRPYLPGNLEAVNTENDVYLWHAEADTFKSFRREYLEGDRYSSGSNAPKASQRLAGAVLLKNGTPLVGELHWLHAKGIGFKCMGVRTLQLLPLERIRAVRTDDDILVWNEDAEKFESMLSHYVYDPKRQIFVKTSKQDLKNHFIRFVRAQVEMTNGAKIAALFSSQGAQTFYLSVLGDCPAEVEAHAVTKMQTPAGDYDYDASKRYFYFTSMEEIKKREAREREREADQRFAKAMYKSGQLLKHGNEWLDLLDKGKKTFGRN